MKAMMTRKIVIKRGIDISPDKISFVNELITSRGVGRMAGLTSLRRQKTCHKIIRQTNEIMLSLFFISVLEHN
jgi:hypothetical protein